MQKRRYLLYYLDTKIVLNITGTYTIGRSSRCDVVLPHTSVSRAHAEIVWGSGGFVIRDLGSTNGTLVDNKRITEYRLYDQDKIKVGDFNLQFRVQEITDSETSPNSLPRSDTLQMELKLAEILQSVNDPALVDKIFDLKSAYENKTGKLSTLAFVDDLTQLYNRRYFDDKLKEEIERAQRYGRPLSLIMNDIDHFKKFNDTYGHQKGDEVLQVVAKILRDKTRYNDINCRYGGEEMVIILPETTLEEAGEVAEHLRVMVMEGAEEEAGVHITISMGVSCITPEVDTPEKLIHTADAALYTAKNKGRNQVAIADV